MELKESDLESWTDSKTFPYFPTDEECDAKLAELKRFSVPCYIGMGVGLALFVVGAIIALSSLPGVFDGKYTSMIIAAVLCGIGVIIFAVAYIVFIVLSKDKYTKAELKYFKAANERYAHFIEMGNEPKEAYRLTIEEADRKNVKEAKPHKRLHIVISFGGRRNIHSSSNFNTPTNDRYDEGYIDGRADGLRRRR